MKQTAADILEKAAESYEAETVNWCQEAWVDPDLDGEYAHPRWWTAIETPFGLMKDRDWNDMPNEAAVRINACAMGALALADGWTWQQNMQLGTELICDKLGSDELKEAIAALRAHVVSIAEPDDYLPRPDDVPGWNDQDGRTKAEVVEAMKATAKDLRNKEGNCV